MSPGSTHGAEHREVVPPAPEDDDRGNNSGAAYIFTNASGLSTQWVQFQKLVPLDLAAGHEFGNAVAISGNTIAVAVHLGGAAPSPGAVYIFQRGPTNCFQVQKLSPFDGANGDDFGFSIGMDRDTLVVGARADDDNGTLSGAAFVYARTNATNWSFVKKLIRNDPAAGDEFGPIGKRPHQSMRCSNTSRYESRKPLQCSSSGSSASRNDGRLQANLRRCWARGFRNKPRLVTRRRIALSRDRSVGDDSRIHLHKPV